MSDPQQASQLSSIFPGPPPFYESFTEQNLAQLAEHKNTIDGQKHSVPDELKNLIPPPIPTTGSYQCFGGRYDIEEKFVTLEEQGIERLFPLEQSESQGVIQSQWTLDRAFELKKLSKSILLNFLELTGTLSNSPEQYGRKLEDLRVLFINAHHLLNEYRPHQARETLILMMEKQLERTRAEVEGVRRMKGRVEETLKSLEDAAPTAVHNGNGVIHRQRLDSFDQQGWGVAMEELGTEA